MTPRRLKTVLTKLREDRKLSKLELARRAEITDAYLVQLENGTRTNPSLDVLKRLAKALGVPVAELLE